jgi:hypothetical protein
VKVDAGKIERSALQHLEGVGCSRRSALAGLDRSSLAAEAPSGSRE